MEGKAGVRMDSRRGKSRGKSNRPLKRSLRRAVAWLLVFCMCMANMNSAAFAAEIATASNALMAATPSDAKATDSDAMEILMPEEVISGEDLATEAARAISEGNEFDFDSEIQVKKDDQGKDEGYEELFKGRRSFVLFADNGNGGRIQGDNPNAYGYILVQVDEKDYKAFEEEAGAAKATNSNATDSDAAERSWTLTGDEELVFLYINADDGSVTFTLNIENLQADDIVVPSYSELREEQKAEEEESKEESEANNPATLPADDGSENGGSAGGSGSGSAGSSDSAGDMEEIEDADKPDGSSDGQGSESGTDGGSEDSTDGAGQGSEDAGNSDSSDGAEDADKPDDSDDGQNGSQDAGNSAEDGNGSQSGSGSDTGSGDTDSGKAEGSGDAGSQKPDDSGDSQKPDSGNSSDTGNGSDKGDIGNTDKGDSGKGDSDKGDSGSSSSDKGSSDKGNTSSDKGSSDKGNSSSSDKGSSSSDKGGSSDTAKLSKSSYDVPVVMGPNPNAEFESDEFGDDISFDEWQEMMEEAEEEEEEDYEDYIEETDLAYEDEDGTTYLGMSMLPAVSATVKKTEKSSGIARLFKKSRSVETEAVVMAGTAALSDVAGITVTSAYKQIEELDNGNYRLHLGLAGGGDKKGFDIVLVVDESSSMDKSIGGYHGDSKMDILKEALYGTGSGPYNSGGFIRNIKQNYPQSRFSIVTYGGEYKREQGWTSSQDSVLKAVGRLDAGYGDTNYEAGLWGAIQTLKQRGESDNIPVVVFLTDGLPTAYQSQIDKFDYGKNNNRYNSDYPNENVARGTMAAALGYNAELEALNGNMYVVGFGVPNSIPSGSGNYTNYKPIQYLSAMAGVKGADGNYKIPGADETPDNVIEISSNTSDPSEELNQAFQDISESLKMKNVVIRDTLSKYVEFLATKMTDGTTGNPEDLTNAEVVTIDKGGNETIYQGADIRFIEPAAEGETWGIEVKFGENTELDPDLTYELRFDIKKNEAAFAGEIPDTDIVPGGENTNYKGTDISSPDKTGLRTNESATYSYGTIRPQPYPHPIIPAPEKPPYVPDHSKVIKDNGDGTYDLTLDVTSGVKSEEGKPEMLPADIVFVLDGSSSMEDSLGGSTRQQVVNQALRQVISSLGQQGCDVRYTAIEFPGITKEGWPIETFVSAENLLGGKWIAANKNGDVDSRLSIQIPYSLFGRGTYPEDGLDLGVKAINEGSGRTSEGGTKKYIILLTDGEPSDSTALQDSKNELKDLDKSDDITFYAIRCASDDGGYMQGVVDYVNGLNLHNGSEAGQLRTAISASDIQTVFDEIKNDIYLGMSGGASGVTNVTIEDKLSIYADMVTDVSDLRLTCNAEGALSEDDYRITYDSQTKTITVDFEDDYELVQNATYSITFTIRPSDQALTDYRTDEGYYRNETGVKQDEEYLGDDGTDAPGDSTSSGQPGFASNEEANLTYEYEGKENTEEYPHPVLQVPQTGSFTVQKVIEGSDSKDGQKFIINIEQLVGGDPVPFSSVALVGNGEKSPAVQIDGEQQFKITEAVPMEYAFKEIRVIDENAERADVTDKKFNSDTNILTVASGDKLVVQVVNTFNHKGYFHSVDRVTNYTTGDTNTPFTSDRVGRQAAEDQPKAESAKKKVEIEEEEGEPLV